MADVKHVVECHVYGQSHRTRDKMETYAGTKLMRPSPATDTIIRHYDRLLLNDWYVKLNTYIRSYKYTQAHKDHATTHTYNVSSVEMKFPQRFPEETTKFLSRLQLNLHTDKERYSSEHNKKKLSQFWVTFVVLEILNCIFSLIHTYIHAYIKITLVHFQIKTKSKKTTVYVHRLCRSSDKMADKKDISWKFRRRNGQLAYTNHSVGHT